MWQFSGMEVGEREEFIKIQFIFESPNSYSLPKTSKYMKVLIFNFDGFFYFFLRCNNSISLNQLIIKSCVSFSFFSDYIKNLIYYIFTN
jgi:hypothetical protein